MRQFIQDIAVIRSNPRATLGWPLFCMLVCLVIWSIVASTLSAEKRNLRDAAFREAASLAGSYAEQLTRGVGQLDQIARTTAFYWRKSRDTFRLEEQANQGLYPEEHALIVGITDANGMLATSLRVNAGELDFSDRPYLSRHKSGKTHGLEITPIENSRLHEGKTVNFSRALLGADGKFAGVVFVSVKPDFLTSLYGRALASRDDVLAVLTRDGTMLAAEMGDNIRRHRSIARNPMRFDGNSGMYILPADQNIDGLSRIVAWKAIDNYPLVALAALAEKAVYAPYEEMRRAYLGMAAAGTVMLALMALMGAIYSARLTQRRRHEEEIKNTYRLATDHARESFFMLRADYAASGEIRDFIIEDCNQQGADFFGTSKQHLIGGRLTGLYPPPKSGIVLGIFRQAMAHGFHEDEFRMHYDFVAKTRTVWYQRRIIRSGSGVAVTLRDITDAKTHAQAMAELANSDALTRLPNRHWLAQFLPECLERAGKAGAKVGILYIDLDDFKNVNNTKGHAAGDAVLKAAAQRMKTLLRPGDHVVRLGGDEFTVILQRIVDNDHIARVASRLVEDLSRPYDGGDESARHVINASIGISVYPDHGTDMSILLQHADVAMYAAKAEGKGNFQFYAGAMSDALLHKLGIEQALRHAVKADEFLLHYQPRVDTRSGELRSMEALVRWQHPERGLVPPLEFISVAEDTGLIVELGALVLEKACSQLAEWRRMGLPLKPVSVNVSPRQFNSDNLVSTLTGALARHAIPADLVELEITESCMMSDTEKVSASLAKLKAIGVRISVDDFGTGYSSLSQLQQLDVDVLKVDRSFTRNLADGEQSQAFFMTIVSMAHILDMQVVAEGVETVEQLEILQDLSCNEVQGYLISKPVPANEAEQFLRKKLLFKAPGFLRLAAQNS
ncbi:bifunctional diguanylate cyclase/phosphodiesterase [Noviherbaspirillum humi]|uniref:bifunctional diguanylate cyclase/phosphodiesterase n=1 Tax=Noviherbaspirillum humi TaxID=1688639 RepID=UPI001594F4FB|nr:EAL domain-containing protein [Noviherbaspirillum humi]